MFQDYLIFESVESIDCLSHCELALSNPLKACIEQKEEEGRIQPLCSASVFEPGHCPALGLRCALLVPLLLRASGL